MFIFGKKRKEKEELLKHEINDDILIEEKKELAVKKIKAVKKAKEIVEKKAKEINDGESAGVSNAVKNKDKKNVLLEKILLRPLITEKGTLIGEYNQYIFEVKCDANKIEVKKAVEQVYGITPKKVNIINISGKMVRFGRNYSRRINWRKAIVTLKAGDKIEVYEGV